ncbi:hypothetical protein [Saccharibacillus kuerlensis]|uniref:Uncharacterized protein n=1 Tax=Saccharibacillus kuerlensis TaxID=459527 RepID=A0ABQ2KVJ2_9BACL|nr:hypothetical protein [Saccharibacillus kuerlensis]GGN94729.1 hypothetical protein GCM10010969_09680 [Saccharibacillus kuerlensis]
MDGTLYLGEGVYCHEWIQTLNGTIEAVQLTKDLSSATLEPIVLL